MTVRGAEVEVTVSVRVVELATGLERLQTRPVLVPANLRFESVTAEVVKRAALSAADGAWAEIGSPWSETKTRPGRG